MENINNQLSNLAFRFFEGTLTNEEERELFALLDGNDAQQQAFYELEQKWNDKHTPSLETDMQWHQFWNGIEKCKTLKPKRAIISLRYKLAAAAVLLVLVASLCTYLLMGLNKNSNAYYTCIAPLGGKAEVVLPDGSHVWLNAGSQLRYPASFDTNNREVQLTGEGYFEVAHCNHAMFTVNTKWYDVKVHGTKFNVTAYADDPDVTTTLLEGSVEISNSKHNLMMIPGEKVVFDKSSGVLQKTKTSVRSNAWVQGNTEFESITLADLAKILSRRFNVNIRIQSPQLKNEKFAIVLNNGENLDGILQGLEKTIPIKVVQKGRDVVIQSL